MDTIRVRLALSTGRTHSLYSELVEAPPDGVRYITDPDAPGGGQAAPAKRGFASSLRSNELVRAVADPIFVRSNHREGAKPGGVAVGAGKLLMRLAGGKAPGCSPCDFDVFHSPGSSMVEVAPWIVENDVRWVVDFEHVGSLFGYYGNWKKRLSKPGRRKTLLRQLLSPNCKKLLPWTVAASISVDSIFRDKALASKMEVLPLAIRPSPPKPPQVKRSGAVKVLFIGSVNFKGEFWSKGGYEVLETYRRVRERLGDKVELNFRCWMPEPLQKRYGSMPGMHVMTEVLPREELDTLFWESDVFLFPAHNTPGMAYLEAMRFGLPIVGKDIWANSELVKDGESGFLVKPSEKIPYTLHGMVPNWGGDDSPFLEYMKLHDERVIFDLADRVARLVEDPVLRRRMGERGRAEVEEGRCSIKTRNVALRRIYEEAARR